MKFPFTRRLIDPNAAGSVASATATAHAERPKSVDVSAEFRCLWTVSQFFTVLQRLQLQPERGRAVDLSDLGRRIEEARAQRLTLGFSRVAALQREVNAARTELYELDSTIPVNIMRRFFERLGRFDRAALGEVVRFYLSKALKTPDDRDKVDLLVTRFGSYLVDTNNDIATWRSIDQLVEHVAKLHPSPNDVPVLTRERTIEDLRDMRRLIFGICTFGDLIERKVVSRLRDFKAGLGELFYAPAVLCEVVETNVAVHNKFQELYHTEIVRLQLEAERLTRIQQDVNRLLPALDSHRALSELGSMSVHMQQLLQEVKKDIAERVILDRDVRATVEDEGVPLKTLVDSCEDALRQTSDLVKSLHSALQKADTKSSPGGR
jgi:hypothetical protein